VGSAELGVKLVLVKVDLEKVLGLSFPGRYNVNKPQGYFMWQMTRSKIGAPYHGGVKRGRGYVKKQFFPIRI